MSRQQTDRNASTLYFHLAGARYCAEGQDALSLTAVPIGLTLVQEPENEFDGDAIALCLLDANQPVKVGYVPNKGHTCPLCFHDHGAGATTWQCNALKEDGTRCTYEGAFLPLGTASQLRHRIGLERCVVTLIETWLSKQGVWGGRCRLDRF